MASVIITDASLPYSSFAEKLGTKDIELSIKNALGEDVKVEYYYNMPRCSDRIARGEVAAVIIPQGHGDWNIRSYLERTIAESGSPPVLELYKITGVRGYDREFHKEMTSNGTRTIVSSLESWLRTNAKKF